MYTINGISSVVKYAINYNLPEEKILGDFIVCIPGFTLEKYRLLQRSQLSIFSPHCFGGLITNMLCLPFRSPLGTNGVSDPRDFVKFLREPHSYLEEKLTLLKFEPITKMNSNRQKIRSVKNDGTILKFKEDMFKIWNSSIVKLGDISMSIVHYKTFEDFVDIWEKRKTRIN